jgi:hypothetical protein
MLWSCPGETIPELKVLMFRSPVETRALPYFIAPFDPDI